MTFRLRAGVLAYGGESGDERRVRDVLSTYDVEADVVQIAPGRGTDAVFFVNIQVEALLEHLSSATEGTGSGTLSQFVRTVLLSPDQLGSSSLPHGAGLLVLVDVETGIEILLDAALPDTACQALSDVDLTAYTFGPLAFDPSQQRWRSRFDE